MPDDVPMLSTEERARLVQLHRPYQGHGALPHCVECAWQAQGDRGDESLWPCLFARYEATCRALEAERDTMMQRVLGEIGGGV